MEEVFIIKRIGFPTIASVMYLEEMDNKYTNLPQHAMRFMHYNDAKNVIHSIMDAYLFDDVLFAVETYLVRE